MSKEPTVKAKTVDALVKKVGDSTQDSPLPSYMFPEPASLDAIIKMQMSGLTKLTKVIVQDIYALNITKDTSTQLATCFKLALELKKAEKDLLDGLTQEELEQLANDE